MGSGKSYWGRRWSALSGLAFYDLDSVIELQEGMTIRQIFEAKGEHVFRQKESEALAALSKKENSIIACGGGTPCFHHNLRRMNKAGVSIFLKTPVSLLAERLLPELDHRPVLSHTNAETLPAFIEKKLAERMPYYNKCLFHFDTRFLTDENFKKLVDRCKSHS